VTFEQINPFYTISMKDPTKPVQVGELEIPGYSSYLHLSKTWGRPSCCGRTTDCRSPYLMFLTLPTRVGSQTSLKQAAMDHRARLLTLIRRSAYSETVCSFYRYKSMIGADGRLTQTALQKQKANPSTDSKFST
jgi:Beta propeller domain